MDGVSRNYAGCNPSSFAVSSLHCRWHVLVVKSDHRQQFYMSYAEFLEIGNLLNQSEKPTWIFYAGRGVSGKSTHMKFVDDGAAQAGR